MRDEKCVRFYFGVYEVGADARLAVVAYDCGKKRYATGAQAAYAAQRMSRRKTGHQVRAYRCGLCTGRVWHLTSQRSVRGSRRGR